MSSHFGAHLLHIVPFSFLCCFLFCPPFLAGWGVLYIAAIHERHMVQAERDAQGEPAVPVIERFGDPYRNGKRCSDD